MARILVVDDQEQGRAVLVSLLQYSGHELLEASDGGEALERARSERPDLVITDILMPKTDGWEFARALRSDPSICGTPVMFYSAVRVSPETRDAALACGVSHILSKPIEPEGVLALVEQALRGVPPGQQRNPSCSAETDLSDRIRVLSAKLWQKVQELESARAHLEERVAERTAALESANRELQDEISDRRLIENQLLQANQQLSARALDLEQRTREIHLLTEMSELLQACRDVNEAHQITGQFAERLFPSASGALYLVRDSDDTLESFASWGGQASALRQDFLNAECWALRRGHSHVVEDATTGPACGHMNAEKLSGYLCVPMMTQGRAVGVLHISWSENNLPHDAQRIESARRLAVALADSASLALSNLRLREELKEQAIRDPLTGLFNRRYLDETLHREISRARRAGTHVAIILIDIDHFKRFNDSFGHPAGDDMLRALGRYLQSRVRAEDIPTRYGGEEFALILPGASLEIARERAEMLRAGARGIPPPPGPHATALPCSVTLSLGVAVFPEHGRTGAEAFQAADRALYSAKTAGRDCVAMADNPSHDSAAGQETSAQEERGSHHGKNSRR